MNKTRAKAHRAMRELWEAADTKIQAVAPIERAGYTFREVETEAGAEIERIDDLLRVSADFEKPDGTEESVMIRFPADIGDLSMTEVHIDWVTETDSGTNTPPLRDFPSIAGELLSLL